MNRLLAVLILASIAGAATASTLTAGFAIKAGDSRLVGELTFAPGGGSAAGTVTLRVASDSGAAPVRNDGTGSAGLFDVVITLNGTFSGGPTGLLKGTASMKGTFTGAAGCVANVQGVGSLDGDINLPRGIAFGWSEWRTLEFNGCGLNPAQLFSVEYPPFVFGAVEEVPARNPNAPAIPTSKNPDAIAKRVARSRRQTDSRNPVADSQAGGQPPVDNDTTEASDAQGIAVPQDPGYGSNRPPATGAQDRVPQEPGYRVVPPPTATPSPSRQIAWNSNLNNLGLWSNIGKQYGFECPSGNSRQHGSIYGTDIYTSDSHICPAAVHAGVISYGGGEFEIEVLGAQDSYPGSSRNDIVSKSHGRYSASFKFTGVQAASSPDAKYDACQITMPDCSCCPGTTPVWNFLTNRGDCLPIDAD